MVLHRGRISDLDAADSAEPSVPRTADVLRSVAFYGLFCFSGAAALALQIAWARLFATGLGHEMPAVLAVLGAIFGGMAAGAWWSEGLLSRSSQPQRCYGCLELLAGVWAGLSIVLVPEANHVALGLTGVDPGALRQWVIAFLVPGLVLLPATVAMGASFPAMERLLASSEPVRGIHVAGLYAANTAGAFAGVVSSTSWVLPWLGFSRGIALFAGVEVLCGGLALALVGSVAMPPQAEARVRSSGSAGVAITLGCTGLLGIGYEVLAVRALAEVLENTIYSFAAVLSVFLLGTAAGAAIYAALCARRPKCELRPALLLGSSIATLGGLWLLSHGTSLNDTLRGMLGPTLLGTWFSEFATAGLVLLGPTLLMGALFSDLLRSARNKGLGLGRGLAVNTAGSALAAPVFGVLLLPALGLKWALVLVAWGYVAVGWPWRRGYRWLAAVPLALTVLLPRELQLVAPPPADKLASYRQGIMESVAVVEQPDGNRSLLVNGRFLMGGTGASLAERRHASLPLLLHPNPKRTLFLGLGTGITFTEVAFYPGVVADGVELVPEVVEAMSWFRPQNEVPAEAAERLRIHVADARRFVLQTQERYDVIVADLFHPARDGAGALYAVEQYRAIRGRLAAGGLCCQWLPLYQLGEGTLRVIVRTFMEVFPETRAFLLRENVDTPVIGLVGSLEPRRYGADYFRERVANAALQERLNTEQIRDELHLLGCFLAGPEGLHRFSAGAALNTDDRPVVLFDAPRFNLTDRETSYGRLTALLAACPVDTSGLIASGADADRQFADDLRQFLQARNVYLHGLVAEAENRTDQAIEAYLQSARLSRSFSLGYAQCLSIAMQMTKARPDVARELLKELVAAQPDRPVAAELLERLGKAPPK